MHKNNMHKLMNILNFIHSYKLTVAQASAPKSRLSALQCAATAYSYIISIITLLILQAL